MPYTLLISFVCSVYVRTVRNIVLYIYNASKYYADLLQTASLPQLQRAHAKLFWFWTSLNIREREREIIQICFYSMKLSK